MMEIWRANKVDIFLKEAYEKGIILSGLSAGSICWFKYGHSDSNSFRNKEGYWDYIRAEGLGLINGIHCPHYNQERREGFDEMMISQDVAGIALEDNVALVIVDNKYRILKSDESAKAYKFYNKNGEVIKKELHNKELRNITELLIEK